MQSAPAKLMYLVLKNRRFLIRTILFVMLPTIGITYLLPRKYTVTTVILPPEEQNLGGMTMGGFSVGELAGFFSGGMGYSLPLMTTLGDVYVTILNSRSLIDHVILKSGYLETVNLDRRYEREPYTALYLARKQFRKNYSATTTSSGFIQLEITTGSPEFSILVAEEVIASLDSINMWVLSQRQIEDRVLLERQLHSADSILSVTSGSLLSFEETYGFIEPNAVLTQLMDVLSEMKARYVETVITADAIRRGVRTGRSATLTELDAEAAAIGRAISDIESGSSTGGLDIGIRVDELPVAMLEYARLRTDYEVQIKMVSMLSISLQQAMIQEESIHSTLRVLDSPDHPGWKSKPKKLLIWIEVFLATVFILCCYLLGRERWHALKLERPESWDAWNNLFTDVRSDFRRKPRRQ